MVLFLSSTIDHYVRETDFFKKRERKRSLDPLENGR
jgi:hypothetical protein